MASKAFLLAVMVAAAMAAPAFAVDYVVGDDNGWKLNVNYSAWAQDKVFYVGDTITFKYAVGDHNVYKVNGSDFKSCTVPQPGESLRSGNDKITLATPGRKWYLCGVGNGTHCENGMRLVINVFSGAPTPAPAPAVEPWPIYNAPSLPPMYGAPSRPFYGAPSLPPIYAAPSPPPVYGAPAKKPMSVWSNWKLKFHF
ncbi:blue copper protein 1a-like [Salvia splendens]|uniref:blue copper protein 1a-like n=1 Tax=Salvia splendens TaxID=180675 RepID=UPI0011022CCE|nr:blue copper protein 1a-like [Salvia splendens]